MRAGLNELAQMKYGKPYSELCEKRRKIIRELHDQDIVVEDYILED